MSTQRIFVSGLLLILLAIGSGLLLTRPSMAMPTIQTSPPADGIVQRNANLRAGPGTTYAVVGTAKQGDVVDIAGCNTICDWYQLADRKWIAASLVELVPDQTAARSEPITVVGWNTELNGADVKVIAARIAAFQDVDLWGLVEINRPSYTQTLELAAEDGENADYASVLSESGGGDRILALYDTTRFTLVDSWELTEINTTSNARAALVLQLQESGRGEALLFMVNHLYRSRNEERYKQARLLNEWAAQQTLPVIAVGDYNFDWAVDREEHDTGYDLLTNGGEFVWVKPETLVTTQCSGWPCQYNSVLDFVFVAGPAQQWRAESKIVVVDGDFPDSASTSDHRPVLAQLWPVDETISTPVTAVPTATMAPVTATAKSNANLRTGPGTTYAITGSAKQGQTLSIVGRNQQGDWYKLDSGAWIAASLVNNAPAASTLQVITNPTTAVAAPPTATVAPAQPTATPAAVQPTSTQAAAQPTPTPAPPTAAPVASGAAQVVIQGITYDGQVYRVESDEYAVIANVGTAPVNLGGWRLNAGDPGQDFHFPSFELAPGQRVRVYTNEHHQEFGGFSFGSGRAIWNNDGDCGFLFDASGNPVADWCY